MPTFTIIGAAKSAATSLATALGCHPEIQISQSMEPKFVGRHYLRGCEWYANQFEADPRRPLQGETSTMNSSSYGSYARTPELIHHHSNYSIDLFGASSPETDRIPLAELARPHQGLLAL